MLHRIYIQPVYVSYNEDLSDPDMFIEVFPNAKSLNLFCTRFYENPEEFKEPYTDHDDHDITPIAVWLGSTMTNAMEDDWEN